MVISKTTGNLSPTVSQSPKENPVGQWRQYIETQLLQAPDPGRHPIVAKTPYFASGYLQALADLERAAN